MPVLKDLWLVKELGNDVAHILCNGREFCVPRFALPENIREGDVLEPRLQNGELLKRKEELIKLFKNL